MACTRREIGCAPVKFAPVTLCGWLSWQAPHWSMALSLKILLCREGSSMNPRPSGPSWQESQLPAGGRSSVAVPT
jgi:hypothetical protein